MIHFTFIFKISMLVSGDFHFPFTLHHTANPLQPQLGASKKCREWSAAVSSSNSLVKLIQCINCVQKGLKYQLIYES